MSGSWFLVVGSSDGRDITDRGSHGSMRCVGGQVFLVEMEILT